MGSTSASAPRTVKTEQIAGPINRCHQMAGVVLDLRPSAPRLDFDNPPGANLFALELADGPPLGIAELFG